MSDFRTQNAKKTGLTKLLANAKKDLASYKKTGDTVFLRDAQESYQDYKSLGGKQTVQGFIDFDIEPKRCTRPLTKKSHDFLANRKSPQKKFVSKAKGTYSTKAKISYYLSKLNNPKTSAKQKFWAKKRLKQLRKA